MTTLNGEIKIQVPEVKVQSVDQKVWLKMAVGEQEFTKKVDYSKPKLSIAVIVKMVDYKIMDMDNFLLSISVWETREDSEEGKAQMD